MGSRRRGAPYPFRSTERATTSVVSIVGWMIEIEPREVVAELWARMQRRDWDGLRRLLDDDFSIEWPDTRVRIRGANEFVEFNREYPEGWTIEVRHIVADGPAVVSE